MVLAGMTGATARVAAEPRGIKKVAPYAPVRLSVGVQVDTGTDLRPVRSGDVLRSGDRVQFLVSTDVPAYLYVAQYFPDGAAAVLHPEHGDVALEAGREVRIPEAGAWFELDEHPGDEQLYFIASVRPLHEADGQLSAAIERIRASKGPPTRPAMSSKAATPRVAAALPPPSAFGLGSRGLVKVGPLTSGARVEIESDETGVALYHFLIRHRPRI